ncbi:unnamed protein product, partial [Symbiodinium microadriaticum]
TGEVLNPETLKRQTSQASEQNHSPQGDGSDVQESATKTATAAKVKAFDARARAEFRATAALASSRLRSMKLRPDHSTFSALNVDTLPSKPKSSPLASTCEGGNILLRPCRPIKEKPTSRISRPLPEVPGFPFDKVPASTAQMLAVLSLEPGLGKASKSSKAAKVRSAAPAPKPWQLEAREAPPKPSYTARSSDFEPSSTSGEAKPKKDAEADASTSQTHLKKDSDEDGKAQSKRSLSPAERSTSAASQEGPPVSQKTRWADVVSDDEECPWQTQAKSSEEEITQESRHISTAETPQERSFASPGSFSKTRWADVDSDDDQLLPSGEEEDEESSSSPAEPAERQVRVRGEARRCQVKAEARHQGQSFHSLRVHSRFLTEGGSKGRCEHIQGQVRSSELPRFCLGRKPACFSFRKSASSDEEDVKATLTIGSLTSWGSSFRATRASMQLATV